MDTGTQLIAQIPTPIYKPAKLAIASEVATMDYCRTILHLPVPRVITYSSDASTSPIGAEFILREHAPGVTLDERFHEDTQGEKELDWPTEQMMGLCDDVLRCETKFLKARFACYGSLFYKEDVSPELRDKPLYHVSVGRVSSRRICY